MLAKKARAHGPQQVVSYHQKDNKFDGMVDLLQKIKFCHLYEEKYMR